MPGLHVTDRQVRRFMTSRWEGHTQAVAAAQTGFSEHWAVIASLNEIRNLVGVKPQTYLADVIVPRGKPRRSSK